MGRRKDVESWQQLPEVQYRKRAHNEMKASDWLAEKSAAKRPKKRKAVLPSGFLLSLLRLFAAGNFLA